jgi:hypothetical protein
MLTFSFLQLALCCLLNAFQMREAICAVQRNLYNRPLVSSSAGPSHVSCASLRTQIKERDESKLTLAPLEMSISCDLSASQTTW